jgi:hypothetical protein
MWTMAAGAQSVAASACPGPIPYREWNETTHPVNWVEIHGAAGGRLSYFPARHSADPDDPQFAELERRWTEARPTIAFYEGPNRPVAASAAETIRQTGESGFLRFLARRDGVQVARLEPPPLDEVHHLVDRFGAERTELFYLLRETARLRERRGLSAEDLQDNIAQLIVRMAALPGAQPAIRSLDDLRAAYARHWTSPADWRQAPSAWFDPLKDSAETGGVFTNELNRASSEFRNAYMVRVLADAVRSRQRVFAVVGGNHVPMQEAALRCEVGESRMHR